MTPSQPDSEVPSDSTDDAVSPENPHAPEPALDRALHLVRFLRANCDWDAAQTPHSLLPYLLEEAHETADAVASGDEHALQSEIGDLLLNVAFQIVLAEERQAFTARDVAATLETKMRRRHPHIYGDGPRVDWESLKAQERARASDGNDSGAMPLLHGIASGLEPLSRAHRIQERVATVGFDWPDPGGALAKVHEEVAEVSELLDRSGFGDPSDADALEEEIGDLLFAVVNLARLSGVHSMRALVRANAKFSLRFGALEELARERGVQLGVATLEELDALWDEVKRRRSTP